MDRKDVTPDQSIGSLKMPGYIEAPAELISDTRSAVVTITAETVMSAETKVYAENPRLAVYRHQYDRLPDNVKKRCSWETVAERLLANDSEKMKLAQSMQDGGELVGVDAKGKALFKDKGVEPVMYGYNNNKNEFICIYDRDAGQMGKVDRWADYFEIREQVWKDGYELFPIEGDDDDYDFSDEIKQVQSHTKEPFVASKDRKEWRGSWLESGDNPEYAHVADFSPDVGRVYVYSDHPGDRLDRYGAVRLLRV